MSRRLKPSDVGYHGKGVPDSNTLRCLQRAYSSKIVGTLSPEIRAKFDRMRELAAKGMTAEVATLATELAPHLHFKVDDVDWEC